MKLKWSSRLLALLLCVALLPMQLFVLPAAAADQPTLKNVTVSNKTLAMKVGQTTDLTATVVLSNNSAYAVGSDTLPVGMTVEWTVEDNRNNEVTVTPTADPLKATVTAIDVAPTNAEHKEVTIKVTARWNNLVRIATCEVTVSPEDPASVTVTPSSTEIAPGGKLQLYATVKPETNPPPTVTWGTKNAVVATVDSNGLLTGVSAGQTEITATAGSNVGTCAVTVLGIVLKETSVTMRERGNHTLQYEVFGSTLKKQTIEWSSSDTTVVQVNNGYLYGIKEGTATITAKVSGSTYSATCEVKVERNTADPITVSVDAGEPVPFSSLVSRIQTECSKVLGRSLSHVGGLTVATKEGTLYYRYQSDSDTGAGIGAGELYYVTPTLAQRGLSDVTFVPKADFSGKAVISYTGYADATTFFQGTIEVTVAQVEDIVYTIAANKPLQFNADDFNRLCRSRTGRDLASVSFSLPDSNRGTLYYRYTVGASYNTPVEATKEYKLNGSPALNDVYFVPSSGYSGEVILSFLARDVNGTSFRSSVRVQVSKATGNGDINYTITKGGWVTMDNNEFNTLCRSATGYSLDYVRFTLPPSSQGKLYYNYSGSTGGYSEEVTAERNYYYNSTPYLRRVTFAATSSYTGTVNIPFRAWDTKGNQFSGTVTILVESNDGGNVRYTAYQGGKVNFDDADFNSECQKRTGSSLSYVQFQLPSSSQGALYYNYTSSGNYDSAVTSSRKYYRYSTPYLDKVTFVPNSSFVGTATIPYTGWSTNGKSFTGTVTIDVYNSAQQISYTIRSGGVADFNAVDFDRLCEYYTGDPLRYVRFTLPASSRGVLYYDYNTTSGSYGSKVSSYTNYYFSSSPYLERVSFVADDGYAGTFEISFTGWSTAGKSFTSTVQVIVEAPQGPATIYYTAANGTVNFQSSDFVSACDDRGLGSLSSVRFQLPSSSQGKLYYRYNSSQSGSTSVQNTTSYYPSTTPRISDVTFVAAAGFSGQATVTYTGTDSRGNTYQGQIRINVPIAGTSRYFNDLTNYAWAVSSIDRLYEMGVVTGTGGGRFSPQNSISRGDFMLMLDRAFDFADVSGTGFTDVPAGSYYGSAIASAKALGIATGYANGTFQPNAPVTRQDAMVFLKRAMAADGWNMGSGDRLMLQGFRDGAYVAEYAVDAVSTMVGYGILTGNNNSELNPTAYMSRAEMAVVLTRVLDL
ncbi:S-layer homology domain-containing protein [Candidatus Avoscillospira sp. LCP25S3_F1]|uniref:S-layer homology domain-containing protein n=1 Tax=Candidatus Avoscillospira sp. LCP25S3_F1 TaxID=3438825 RepID=UPI003F8FAC97